MLEDRILKEVKQIAKREGYLSVMWHGYGTEYVDCFGNKVENEELDELDVLYCDEVHAGGIEFYFKKHEDY